MKICIVSQTFAPQHEGGAEFFVRQAASALSEQHDVVVLSLGDQSQYGLEPGEQATSASYRLFRVQFRNAYLPEARRPNASVAQRMFWHLRCYLGAVKDDDILSFFLKEQFDVIYAHNCSRMLPSLYRCARKADVPLVQHIHDYAMICSRTSIRNKKGNCTGNCLGCRILTSNARRWSNQVDQVIAVSDFVKTKLQSSNVMPNAKWHVLHNTIAAPSTARDESRPRPFATGMTFGYLGALTLEKGVDTLVKAFCEIQSNSDIRLLIAGRGDIALTKSLQSYTETHAPGRVEWLGHVPPDDVYSRADMIVSPSVWNEPQSLVIMEAANAGLPVIASAVGGSTEVIQKYRIGWLFPPGDTQALSKLMQEATKLKGTNSQDNIANSFPGLVTFQGTAKSTNYYEKVSRIISSSVYK